MWCFFWQPGRSPRLGTQVHRRSGTVLGGWVLVVKAGSNRVRNLFQPVRLTFTHNTKVNNLTRTSVGNEELFFLRVCWTFQMEEATCVFWQERDLVDGAGEAAGWRLGWSNVKVVVVCFILWGRVFAGYWSAEGCNTSVTGAVVDCCCNHLSFFAVLVVNEENK